MELLCSVGYSSGVTMKWGLVVVLVSVGLTVAIEEKPDLTGKVARLPFSIQLQNLSASSTTTQSPASATTTKTASSTTTKTASATTTKTASSTTAQSTTKTASSTNTPSQNLRSTESYYNTDDYSDDGDYENPLSFIHQPPIYVQFLYDSYINNEEIRTNLSKQLTGLYKNTRGFKNLTWTTPNNEGSFSTVIQSQTLKYEALYDLKTLNVDPKYDLLAAIETNVTNKLCTINLTGGLQVDVTRTKQQMQTEIQQINNTRQTILCKSVTCNDWFQCQLAKNGSITCNDKCSKFSKDNCMWEDSGNCTLNDKKEAVCRCNAHTLYDGDRCIHQNYIIAIASGGGGILLLVCLSIILCICIRMHKKQQELEKESLYRYDHAFGMNSMEETDLTGNPYEALYRGQQNDHVYNSPGGPENKGYVDDSADEKKPEVNGQISFAPNLKHIDPSADYSIKRPTVKSGESSLSLPKGAANLYMNY